MSLVMFRRSLKDLRWATFWYALGLALYGLLILSAYPGVRDNAQTMQELIDAFPKALMDAFGGSDMTSLTGFTGGKFLNVMWPLIAGVFLIMAGTATVAREVERGTAEMLLSVPVSRTRLLVGKMAALLVATLVLVAATVGAIALGAALVDETLEAGKLVALGMVLTSFAVAVGGFSVLVSAFSKERGRAAGVAAGVVLASYAAWVIAELSDDWAWLDTLSIFTAFEPQRALDTGEVDPFRVGALLCVGILCSAAALVVFRRRDVVGG
jgi:ABC-2 type transport system permease protein